MSKTNEMTCASPDPAERLALAELFYSELSDQVETFTSLGETHGPATLANLFHIHAAITTNGFVELLEESAVLDVLADLPSKDRWLQYVRTGGGDVR